MEKAVYALCALCAVAGLCDRMTADGRFARPARMLTGLEVALTVFGITKSLWETVLKWIA